MLTGSVLGPHRTAVSDLDIVVMLPDGPAALSFGGRWVSGGKWLLRELREYDPELAERWLAARDDPAPPARQVLASAGGPLFDGHRAGDG
jgi:hypothetical protein